MKKILVAGLGNPGTRYRFTKHNDGFIFLDFLKEKYSLSFSESIKFSCEIAQDIIDRNKIFFIKPLTYMNLSGVSIDKVMKYYDIDIENLIVCYDEVALNFGDIMIKPKGSSAGHNGIQSIIDSLGSNQFHRMRIGVGPKPKEYILKDFVLSKISDNEMDTMKKGFKNINEEISFNNFEKLMKDVNSIRIKSTGD